jgi:hypothetical protein
MSERGRLLCAIATVVGLCSCSVRHLSYAELERDIDAIVRLEGSGDQQRLVYLRDVEQSPWYSRWLLVRPLKPVLIFLFGDTTHVELDAPSPSGRVRELAQELAPNCGVDLLRAAATAQRLVRIAELDDSALNRIIALNGLDELRRAHELDVYRGIERGELGEAELATIQQALQVVKQYRPSARVPMGAPLAVEEGRAYAAALRGLTAQPVATWQARLALVADLATALALEQDDELGTETQQALRLALQYAVQVTLRRALQDQDIYRNEVRLRALEILHAAGGVDSVPLLLALMAKSPAQIANGERPFDFDLETQLRLIHMCGQLDRKRALQQVQLPGRQAWQSVAPIEFLARIALDDEFLSPLQLPALEAMALCLQRPRIDLGGEGDQGGVEWVRAWYEEYRRKSS